MEKRNFETFESTWESLLNDIKSKMVQQNKTGDDHIMLIAGYRPDNHKDSYTYQEFLDVLERKVTQGHVYDVVEKLVRALMN